MQWIGFSLVARRVQAQGRQVVTMQSGLQHEGLLVTVPEISEQLGDMNFEGKPVLMIVDGLTRTFVNVARVSRLAASGRSDSEIEIWQRTYDGKPGAAPFLGATPFTLKGHRVLTVNSTRGPAQYVQGITKLHPRYVEVESLSGGTVLSPREWAMSLAIGTVPSNVIRSVMENEIIDPNRITAWLEIVEFFVRAERYQEADDELLRIKLKFPQQAALIDEKRTLVRQEFAKQQLREILLQLESGQSDLATRWINAINRQGIALETVAELDDILDRLKKQELSTDQVRQQVVATIDELNAMAEGELSDVQREMLKRFGGELETQLNANNVQRLDGFERIFQDANQTPRQKISLAITGWILGSNNANGNWAIAQSLLEVRDLVTQYLNSDTAEQRNEILEQLKNFESSDVTWLAPMLSQMLPHRGQDHSDYTGAEPIEFTVTLAGTTVDPQPRTYRCLAQLPTQYDPFRRYPLLVALPGSATVEQHLRHFCGSFNERLGVLHGNASRNGTIVVSVDWRNTDQRRAEYSAREHQVVLRALRESMRRFAVDSDRVFLQGHGIGADVAYDVGTSHPDHWAGIIGVSATGIRKYAKIYAENKSTSQLPIYAVVGQRHIGSIRNCKDGWNTWLKSSQRNDCTLVQYAGRLDEQFLENVPDMFTWMRAHRRRYPNTSGFSFEAKSLRPWDNYWWFLELNGFPLKNVTWPELYTSDTKVSALKIDGEIRGNRPNSFVVGPSRAGEGMTLWLRPDYFDFSKEIEITGRGRPFRGSVRPSREVLLEDARRRADFQRPFWARIDHVEGKWIEPR